MKKSTAVVGSPPPKTYPKPYVCSLTETHVQRIEGVLAFMADCDIKKERASCARTISVILRSKGARRSIGPKAKTIGRIPDLAPTPEEFRK